jgi:hypothetical protein
MKREVIALPLIGGSAAFECPSGKRLRIMSVVATGMAHSGGSQVEIRFLRSGGTVAVSFSGACSSGLQTVGAFIGGPTLEPDAIIDVIDPVTGVVTYNAQPFGVGLMAMALPDIWWTWPIVVVVTSGPTAGTVVAELEETA